MWQKHEVWTTSVLEQLTVPFHHTTGATQHSTGRSHHCCIHSCWCDLANLSLEILSLQIAWILNEIALLLLVTWNIQKDPDNYSFLWALPRGEVSNAISTAKPQLLNAPLLHQCLGSGRDRESNSWTSGLWMFPHQYNGKLLLAVVGYTRPAEFKKTFQVKALPSLPLSALSSAFQWCGTTEQGQLSSRGISVPWFQFFTQASPGLGAWCNSCYWCWRDMEHIGRYPKRFAHHHCCKGISSGGAACAWILCFGGY